MANTYLTRTPSSAGNRKTWTWSAWIKKTKLGNVENFFTAGSTSDDGAIRYLSSGNFNLYETNSNGTAYSFNLETNALYRDVNGWYHLVVAVDTTQATASDRVKMYVNGSQVTFNGSAYPSQNFDTFINNNVVHHISRTINTTYGTREFDGLMSHIHFIDGTVYDATAFGQYDANGVWTIKTSPSVTYGTNGFFILKNGNSVTDQSGNSNNFTVGGGTLTKTEDSPSNVFATFNPLISSKGQTFSKGNTEVSTTVSNRTGGSSTIGMSSGKYYAEFKIAAYDSNRTTIGITSNPSELDRTNVDPTDLNYGSGIYFDGRIYVNTSVVATVGATTLNDIIGVAVNLDDNNILYYINGVVQNSGTPISITALSSTDTGNYFFSTGDRSQSAYGTVQANFGNGYFGTTPVASAGTNASGIGIFEFDVPTGFTSLSTKGLNL